MDDDNIPVYFLHILIILASFAGIVRDSSSGEKLKNILVIQRKSNFVEYRPPKMSLTFAKITSMTCCSVLSVHMNRLEACKNYVENKILHFEIILEYLQEKRCLKQFHELFQQNYVYEAKSF